MLTWTDEYMLTNPFLFHFIVFMSGHNIMQIEDFKSTFLLDKSFALIMQL